MMDEDLLWPRYEHPSDVEVIETVPLNERGLPETTYALLFRAAKLWPQRTALTVLPDSTSRTFSELLGDVHQIANLLRDRGITRGDAVALMSPNCLELITATIGAQLAGIATPVNAGQSLEHVTELLRRSGTRVLITAGPELDRAVWATSRALLETGAIDTVIMLRPTDSDSPPEPIDPIEGVVVEYLSESITEFERSAFDGTAPTTDDVAALFHTGGTTGEPKLAAHTHANEVSNAWMLAANSTFDQDSVIFAALPLFHVNALTVTLLAPLYRGQTVVWAGPLGYRDFGLYAEFWKIVERYQISTMSAVPTVYSVLSRCPIDADISSLQACMVGASMLPVAVRESFESHTGVPLVEGYGLTEATCASARSFPAFSRPDSVGQRLPYQQLKVVQIDDDETWTDLPHGEVGTVVISGPTVFAGYVVGKNRDGYLLDGLGKLRDGWLDTGDVGSIDTDGFVCLAGRAKDVIIRGGHNIDPAVIEDALLAHPDVTGASAVGRPDIHAGEVPVAYATVNPNSAITENELCRWAAAHVSEAVAAPKTVTIIDSLPVTDVGKPYKLALRADVTEQVVHDALAEIGFVERIRSVIENGTVVVVVDTGPGRDSDVLQAALDQYPLRWRMEEQ